MREAGGEALPTWKTLDAKGYVIADLIVARTASAKKYPGRRDGLPQGLRPVAGHCGRPSPTRRRPIVANEVGVTPEVAKHDLSEYDFMALKEQLSGELAGRRQGRAGCHSPP